MPISPSPFARSTAWLIVASLCLAGCRSTDSQVRQAYADYQIAIAANNLPNARKALLTLVNVQDNVPENWVELGKIQAAMGAYGDAWFAFTRAYELNRRDPDILRAVTQLSLRNGDFTAAETHARELEVLAPGDSWIKLADGYAALSQLRFVDAMTVADALLANAHFDSNGKVLKARALLGLSKSDEALELLTAQLAAQPTDIGALQIVERIYEQRNDWAHVAQIAQRLNKLMPGDTETVLLLVSALLRSGGASAARAASFQVLQQSADPATITSVLDIWADYWPSPQRVMDARALGGRSPGQAQKLAYASFLNRVGDPAGASALIGSSATLPVTADNVQANAVRAEGLARSGKNAAATALFGAVLSYDSGNAIALRGRADLNLRAGRAEDAIPDAQKLVSVLPDSARDRLLLSRCYAAGGNLALSERTLWDGFHEIPTNDLLFAALKAGMHGNPEAIASLSQEFTAQRNAELYRGIL